MSKRRENKLWNTIKRWNRHDYIVAICVILGMVVISTAAVFVVRALLTDITNLRANQFTSMTYTNIDIIEPSGKTYSVDLSYDQVTHKYTSLDGTVSKNAQITNLPGEDKKPVYIRTKVIMTICDEQGYDITMNYSQGSLRVTLGDLFQTPGDWWEGANGYYYYKHILIPGQSTSNLFKGNDQDGYSVTINNAIYLPDKCKVHIDVLADSVQAVSTDTVKWTAADYYKTESISEVEKAWKMTPTPATVTNMTEQQTTTCSWAPVTP